MNALKTYQFALSLMMQNFCKYILMSDAFILLFSFLKFNLNVIIPHYTLQKYSGVTEKPSSQVQALKEC